MSMDEHDLNDAYAECLCCDQAIFTLGGEDAQAQYVTLSNGDGRLHTHCRAGYEAEHGPVVCEDDDAVCASRDQMAAALAAIEKHLARAEQVIADANRPGTVLYPFEFGRLESCVLCIRDALSELSVADAARKGE